jgi:hypothetical protein
VLRCFLDEHSDGNVSFLYGARRLSVDEFLFVSAHAHFVVTQRGIRRYTGDIVVSAIKLFFQVTPQGFSRCVLDGAGIFAKICMTRL